MTDRERQIRGLAETIIAPVEKMEQPTPEIEQTRKSTGRGAIAAIFIGLAASGSIATLGYKYINKQAPFDEDNAAAVASSAESAAPVTSADKPDVPDKIYSNNDLKRAIQANHLQATDSDFDFATERPELQAKALILTPAEHMDASQGNQLHWEPVDQRITRLSQREFLVAVKVINPYLGQDAAHAIVPEGLSYRARTADAQNPSIVYFYYTCEDKHGNDAMLAQIGIKDPARPKSLMWAKSFYFPACE